MKKEKTQLSGISEQKKATALLAKKLGKKVRLDEKALFSASFDGSKLSFIPLAVIRPRSERDIEVVLDLANKRSVPVTVRGGGSSLTGSASPIMGGWVLDLSRWQKIVVDEEQGLMKVQAGARIIDIQKKAEEAGWYYPPDPSSKDYSTIGGNIACNAGGMHGGKYGVTRDYILALQGLLPTGERVSWGGHYKKFACGYNLRDLWIGSEGTLGVVTGAILKLIPKPQTKWTVLAAYSNEEKALLAVRKLLNERIQPSILEFLDNSSVKCAERATGVSLFPKQRGKPLLLVEIDGSRGQVKMDKARVLDWAKETSLAYQEAKTEAEAEKLWQVRRKCSGAMFEMGDSKLNEDVVIPLRRQVDFYRFIEKLQVQSGLSSPTFGHAADGNFHVNIMYSRGNASEAKRAKRAVFQLMEKVVALGGTITGEHGIGLVKTPFLHLARNKAEIKAMKAIKMALDPKGILNPGKIFSRFEVWKHKPVKVRLPWDHH
jgi:glycolate oxidase